MRMMSIYFCSKTENEIDMYEACHGVPMTITMANMTDIYSPNFSSGDDTSTYDNNLNCTWIVKSSKWNRIQLTFDSHDRGEIEEKYVISIFETNQYDNKK